MGLQSYVRTCYSKRGVYRCQVISVLAKMHQQAIYVTGPEKTGLIYVHVKFDLNFSL